MQYQSQRGISLVEVVVAMAIIGVMVAAIAYAVTATVGASDQALTDLQAWYLAEEGHEILRYLRDEDWSNVEVATIPDGAERYLDITTTTLAITATPSLTEGKYTRELEFASAKRDADFDVAATGTTDPDTRLVTVQINWPGGSIEVDSLLANINNL